MPTILWVQASQKWRLTYFHSFLWFLIKYLWVLDCRTKQATWRHHLNTNLSISGQKKKWFVLFSSSWLSSLQGFYHWMVSSQSFHLSPPPHTHSLSLYPLILSSFPSLLCFTVLLLPSHLTVSPSVTRTDHGPSARGESQTHSCSSYWGMKLPLHPSGPLKDAQMLKKVYTNNGSKEREHVAETNTMQILRVKSPRKMSPEFNIDPGPWGRNAMSSSEGSQFHGEVEKQFISLFFHLLAYLIVSPNIFSLIISPSINFLSITYVFFFWDNLVLS